MGDKINEATYFTALCSLSTAGIRNVSGNNYFCFVELLLNFYDIQDLD